MGTRLRRLGTWLTHPSGLAGAFLGAAVVALFGGIGLVGLIFGWAYGMVVGALIRMFRVPAGAYPLIGVIAGPLPFAIFMTEATPKDNRGVVALGLVLGLLLGLVEWARARHERNLLPPPSDAS